MTRAVRLTSVAASAALLAVPLARVAGQAPDTALAGRALADRIRGVRTGSMRLSYAVRAGVCGDGADGISVEAPTGETRMRQWTGRGGDGWRVCEPGPAHVTIDVRDGAPRVLHLTVGGPGRRTEPSEHVYELGRVPGSAAAAYLLGVAVRADGDVADRAVLAAAIADSAVIWPDLLRLARSTAASTGARRAATFWAGQFACDAVRARTPHATHADTTGRDVRRQVVFALAQRATDERAPALTRVARTDRDPEVRCSALFWLGQSTSGPNGARVALDLYEDVLRTR